MTPPPTIRPRRTTVHHRGARDHSASLWMRYRLTTGFTDFSLSATSSTNSSTLSRPSDPIAGISPPRSSPRRERSSIQWHLRASPVSSYPESIRSPSEGTLASSKRSTPSRWRCRGTRFPPHPIPKYNRLVYRRSRLLARTRSPKNGDILADHRCEKSKGKTTPARIPRRTPSVQSVRQSNRASGFAHQAATTNPETDPIGSPPAPDHTPLVPAHRL
jgi:hypothetical protein